MSDLVALNSSGKGGKAMKITCICCAGEVNLDHKVFENYDGPVKCFRCGAIMDVRTEAGTVCSLVPSPSEEEQPTRKVG